MPPSISVLDVSPCGRVEIYHATFSKGVDGANRTLAGPRDVIKRVEVSYIPIKPRIDYTDVLSMEFAQWRFNLRSSNTEPVLRLNVESRVDCGLMKEKTAELLHIIDPS